MTPESYAIVFGFKRNNTLVIDLYLVLIPLLLMIAAVFAATEAALFSLSRTQLENLKMLRPGLHKAIRKLIQKPEALLSTIIIGNECVGIFMGTLVVTLIGKYSVVVGEKKVAILSILLSSFLCLVFSEILPKILAFRLPVLTASVLVYPATWAHALLTPIRHVFLSISNQVLRLFNIEDKSPAALSEKDLLTLVEVGAESGSLDSDEKQLILNVFQFSDRPISSVMTAWNQVFTISEDMPITDIFHSVRKKTFSRIPVLSPKGDRVIGILYTKELLKLLLATNPETQADALEHAVFPPYIVSSHKKVSKLFREFKAKKVHIALVVDEFGRHVGVVTLEDLLNALFQTQRRQEEKMA